MVNESERSKISFECGKTGFYLTLFFHSLKKTISKVLGESKSIQDLGKALDDNHGCLSSDLENALQQELFKIPQIEDFKAYYDWLGVKSFSTDKELSERLVKAVKSSRQKGYHGQEHDENMPEVEETSHARLEQRLKEFANLKIVKEEIKN